MRMNKLRVVNYDKVDYESLWKSKRRMYDDRMERYILNNCIPNNGQGWFIDLGCAHGRFSDIYSSRFSNCILLDYSIEHLKKAKHKLSHKSEGCFFIAGSIYALPFKSNVFTMGLMIRVLHHLDSPLVALKEVNRIFQKDANLIISYRNRRSLRNIFRYPLRYQSLKQFKVTHANLVGNDGIQAYTHPKYMRLLMENAGFSIIDYMGSSFFREMLQYISNPVPIEK